MAGENNSLGGANPSSGSPAHPSSGSPDDSTLGEAGLKALQAERQKRRSLEDKLKELQSKMQSGDVLAFELQEARTMITKLENEMQEVETSLRSEIKKRDAIIKDSQLTSAFKNSASEYRLNPKYYDTMLSAHKAQFKISPDGQMIQTADGKTLGEWFESKRGEFPELFLAPSLSNGTNASSQSGGRSPKSRLISRNDDMAFLDNIDAIARGEIVTGD